MQKRRPIFEPIYNNPYNADGKLIEFLSSPLLKQKRYFVRAKRTNFKGNEYLLPNYVEKTEGYLVDDTYLLNYDDFYNFPDSDKWIRILMEYYDSESEEMIGDAWVYIAHPDIVKSVRGE